MGINLCTACFGSKSDVTDSSPDAAVRRQQMAEAAERRAREQESRGIKDVEKVKRQQQRHSELEKLEDATRHEDATLRWQVG